MNFRCPESMIPFVSKVLEGEYDVPWDGKGTCLDIGANCGAFTFYARHRWPECHVIAYEPYKPSYDLFVENTQGLNNVEVYNEAVGDTDKDSLYIGKNNPGECSQYFGIEQTLDTVKINVVQPESIQSCEMVKLDCEGAEGFILEKLNLTKTRFVVFEYHGEHNRVRCDAVMHKNGFKLNSLTITAVGYGVAKYSR